jgi:glycosyltransferase involved in cell wall biosynthesis
MRRHTVPVAVADRHVFDSWYCGYLGYVPSVRRPVPHRQRYFESLGVRVLVNGLSARIGGGQIVLHAHLAALSDLADSVTITVLSTAHANVPTQDRYRLMMWPKLPTLLRIIGEQAALPLLALRTRADLVYCLGNFGLLIPSRPVVQLLQNPHHFRSLAPTELREMYGRRSLLRFRIETWLARHTARRAAVVCTVSESMAQAVRSEWPEVAAKVRVILNQLPDDPPPAELSVKPGPYCLFVANDSPHKQWGEVISAFHSHPELPTLVLVGQPATDRSADRASLEDLENLSTARRVLMLGSVQDRAVIRWLYANATAVLVNSTSETFGLTLLEALAYNGRVAASDLPAHREVAPNSGVGFYAVGDYRAMVEVLASVVTSSPCPLATAKEPGSALTDSLQSVFDLALG